MGNGIMGTITVRAEVEVGMKLVKKPSLDERQRVVYVTAIGELNILAIDEVGTEHKIPFKEVDDYQMSGWRK